MKQLGLLTLLILAAVVPGCKVYDESLIKGAGASAQVPPRPHMSTSAATDSIEVTFAIRDILLEQPGDLAEKVGLDLDEKDTTQNPDDTECTPPAGGEAPADGENGIDNAMGQSRLLATVGGALPCLSDDIALNQGKGLGTMLLRVRKWNGNDNDAQVEVTLAQSVFATSADPMLLRPEGSKYVYNEDAGPELEGQDAPPPVWDGNDSYFVDKADFGTDANGPSLNEPRVSQNNAYISARRLVFNLPLTAEIELLAGEGIGLSVRLSDGVIFGDISEDATELTRGVIAGRFAIVDLEAATPSVGICSVGDQDLQKVFFENESDVMENSDNRGPTALCDAMSIGITLTAKAGQIASIANDTIGITFMCPTEAPFYVPNNCCPRIANKPEGCDADALLEMGYTDSPNEIPVPVPDDF